MKGLMRQAIRRIVAVLVVAAHLVAPFVPLPAHAAQRSGPAWWGYSAGASSLWHYRVPLNIATTPSAGNQIQTNVDFAALLTTLGVTGTLDVNSPRVVDASGTLVPTQEFSDSIYNAATDAVGNGRGEIKFLATSNATQYWLYFDITANGTKPSNAAAAINGNFENASIGTGQPAGWTLTTKPGYVDAQVVGGGTLSVTTDGANATKTVTSAPHTGLNSYLLGARTTNETTTGTELVVLSRTIAVPATNPGNLTFHFRTQGWDSNDNGVTGTYDYLRAYINNGATTTDLVGPLANNYVTAPFSPNKGTNAATTNASGYGQYNGFDTDTRGNHHAGMTVANGSEPWWDASYSLAAYAGKTITLTFSATHTVLYRSWWHIDDVEWSILPATVGTTPQAFGAVLELPAGAASTTYYPAQVLAIRGRLDAVGTTGSVQADLYNPSGTAVVTGIVLFNDGTHGDVTSGDALWTNDGSVAGSPTYTFPANAPPGTWTVVLRAVDGAASPVRIEGQPATPVNGSNFYNVDTQTFTFSPYNTLSGHVYLDNNRNGINDTGDAAYTGIQVKLVQAGAVVAQATPDATGSYSFGSLKNGTYTIVPSINNLTTDATPTLPAGYAQSQPKTVSFTTDLAGGQAVVDDIGLYAADISVSGNVFSDNGAGGATPLDGVQGASELPLQAVVVQAKNSGGTLLAQTTTVGDGSFTLGLPSASAGTSVILSTLPTSGYTYAKVFAGSTAGTLNQAAGTVTFTPAANTKYTGVIYSQLPDSTLSASQLKAAQPGQTVLYAHRFNAGETGTLTFTLTDTAPSGLSGWAGVLYRDATCSGTLTGGEAIVTSSISVTAGSSVCVVIYDAVPAAAALNQKVQHQLSASLVVSGGAFTMPTQVNTDITTVGTSQDSGLTLVKAVRNLTTGGALDVNSQALPGQSLQYQVTFRNDTATPVSSVLIYDSVPAYGVFVSAACGTMPTGVTCAVTKTPTVGATTGAIQWNLTGSVPANSSGNVSFNWTLAP